MQLRSQVRRVHASSAGSQAPRFLLAAGQKLKQKKALVVPAAEAMSVLEDEDLAAQAGEPARAPAAPQGTLRQRLDAGDLQEHLRQDPLRLHKATSAPSSLPSDECPCWPLDGHLDIASTTSRTTDQIPLYTLKTGEKQQVSSLMALEPVVGVYKLADTSVLELKLNAYAWELLNCLAMLRRKLAMEQGQ